MNGGGPNKNEEKHKSGNYVLQPTSKSNGEESLEDSDLILLERNQAGDCEVRAKVGANNSRELLAC